MDNCYSTFTEIRAAGCVTVKLDEYRNMVRACTMLDVLLETSKDSADYRIADMVRHIRNLLGCPDESND